MDPHQDPPPADNPQPNQPPTEPTAQQTPGQPVVQDGGWQAPGGWSPEQPPPYGGAPVAPHPGGAPTPYGPMPGSAPVGAPGAPQYGQAGVPPQYGQPGGPVPYGAYPQYGQPYRAPKRQVEVAPAGTPFHRLARTAGHRWWRPLVGTLVLGLFAIAATLIVLIGWEIVHAVITGEFSEPEAADSLFESPTEDLAINLLMLGILTPVVMLTARLIQRRHPLSVASVLQKIRWRWLLLCCLPGLLYLAANIALGNAFEALFPNVDTGTDVADDGSFVGWAKFVVPALVILLLVPFQSAAEEFAFRGWLVQAVGAYGPDNTDGNSFVRQIKRLFRSPWPALVVSSVAFVFGHGYTGWAMADVFLFAMTVGWLTIRTGGLESGIALHTVNNVIAFMLPAALGHLDTWDDQGGAPWPVFVLDVPAIALYAVSVLWLAKRQGIARVS